jgi:hypothetical protein
MNPGKLGLIRRSAYSHYARTRNKRVLHTIAGVACLLLIWLAYGVMPQSAPGGSSVQLEATEAAGSPVVMTPGAAPRSARVSAQHALFSALPSVPEAADTPPPVTFSAQNGDTEPATDSPAEPILPEESTHVPFLRSLMAAVDPGSPSFGYGHGSGAFGAGGFGGGGGGGGSAPGQTPSTLESQFGDTGSERARLLGDHAHEDTFIGNDSTDGGSNNGGSNNGGSNNGDSNNGGSNNGGSNNGGSNNGDSNNGGSNNGGSNDGGSNDGGATDGGATDKGAALADDGPSGGSHDEPGVGDNPGQPNGGPAPSFVASLDVPEPSLMLLSGVGFAAALVRRRTRRS